VRWTDNGGYHVDTASRRFSGRDCTVGGRHGNSGRKTVTLAVNGMYCSACPYIVEQSLAKVGGVSNVAVSYEKKAATVTYDDQKTSLAAMTTATTQAGYPSQPIN
jgi:periplasmic mercuric ion binding protein